MAAHRVPSSRPISSSATSKASSTCFASSAPNVPARAAKWSKLWTDVPRPWDQHGAYTTEQLERMNQEFTAAVERAFRAGGESEMAAAATYDVRRR
jgi:hypothetical protein